MWGYGAKIFSFAFRGFAIRADLAYAIASIAVAGWTGSKDKPVGTLTPWEISWYVGVALLTYLAIRLVLVAPYRLWQEQCTEIGRLNGILELPERVGSEAMHRIRAEKRIELAAKLQEYHYARLRKADTEPLYYELAALCGHINAPADFRWVLGEFVERIGKVGVGDELTAYRMLAVMGSYLHGECGAPALEELRLELTR